MFKQYIAALYIIADPCNYGTVTGETIRDRIMVGIRNSLLPGYLQLDVNQHRRRAVREKEAVHEQQGILKGDSKSNPITLNAVKATHKGNTPCADS